MLITFDYDQPISAIASDNGCPLHTEVSTTPAFPSTRSLMGPSMWGNTVVGHPVGVAISCRRRIAPPSLSGANARNATTSPASPAKYDGSSRCLTAVLIALAIPAASSDSVVDQALVSLTSAKVSARPPTPEWRA